MKPEENTNKKKLVIFLGLIIIGMLIIGTSIGIGIGSNKCQKQCNQEIKTIEEGCLKIDLEFRGQKNILGDQSTP